MKNKWFKHYNDLSEGLGFQNAWANSEYECCAFYYRALELISFHENRELAPGFIKISSKNLCKILNKNERGLVTLLGKFQLYFGDTFTVVWGKLTPNYTPNFTQTIPHSLQEVSDNFVLLFHDKWLELQENRAGKRFAKKEQNTDRSKKIEVRSKKSELRREIKEINKEKIILEELKISGGENMLDKISIERQKLFLETYPRDFVRGEALAACEWMIKNPTKAEKIKNHGQFFSNWLKSGFKKIEAEKQKSASIYKKGRLIGNASGDLP